MSSFASDNTAGAHPSVLEAVVAASEGHAPAYGADATTARAHALLRETFGEGAVPFLVTTGTAANVLALAQVARPHHGVVCPASAHIAVDECGAPGRFAGVSLLTVETTHGKLAPHDVGRWHADLGDEHRVQPRVVSISQATELGTVYTPSEVAALAQAAHAQGMLLHVDGARLANAAASLDTTPRAVTREAGVDVLTVGLTKAGAIGAEAVVFLREGLEDGFAFTRKQGLHLASKMRFVAAQVVALLEGGRWLELAAHANAMALRLESALEGVVEVVHPVETNAVFARVEPRHAGALEAAGALQTWSGDVVRWMTAWDTTPAEVDAFAGAIHGAVRGS